MRSISSVVIFRMREYSSSTGVISRDGGGSGAGGGVAGATGGGGAGGGGATRLWWHPANRTAPRATASTLCLMREYPFRWGRPLERSRPGLMESRSEEHTSEL